MIYYWVTEVILNRLFILCRLYSGYWIYSMAVVMAMWPVWNLWQTFFASVSSAVFNGRALTPLSSSAMGHWGTCPLDFQLFNLSAHFRAVHSTPCGFLSSKNIHTYRFVTSYCMSCIILLCVIPKLFFCLHLLKVPPPSPHSRHIWKQNCSLLHTTQSNISSAAGASDSNSRHTAPPINVLTLTLTSEFHNIFVYVILRLFSRSFHPPHQILATPLANI